MSGDADDPLPRPLTEADKRAGFIQCTTGFSGSAERWKKRATTGMTNQELAKALEYEIGIEGGGSPREGIPRYHYKGAGLQIWLSWDFPSQLERPTFKGAETVAMARVVYGIRHPDDKQMDLFGDAL